MGRVLISLVVIGFVFCAARTACAVVSQEQLSAEIGNRITRVPEFEFIRQEAGRLGVRAWLFGGTAAGYAHYVKWDLDREHGDHRYQPDRFDYDYTNIYRANQDLDIVVDGTPEQAHALQKKLSEVYPHLQGSKTAWEVRLLRSDLGDKLPLLDNPDFLNQNTDSNSTGMIEITPPSVGESRVRDLRDWNSATSNFLRDLQEGSIRYYYSPAHKATRLYREGRNPEILSAIRYLTKAFQYDLHVNPEDVARIKSIVADFDPQSVKNSYVAKWIEKNGKKLIQNAVNIEIANGTLEGLGLRKKLIALRGDVETKESLAWWMNKEPLKTKPLGTQGRTARELFEKNGWARPGQPLIVAHETQNLDAYESITRAHTGDPNVLISRENAPGESAIYGDGFYTKAGRSGITGKNATIRFELAPNAREGADFFLAKRDYIVVRNKAALRVIPESMNLSLAGYFRMLAENPRFDPSDRGVFEKLKRRVSQKAGALSPEELSEITGIVRRSSQNTPNLAVLEQWYSLGFHAKNPSVFGPVQYFEILAKARNFANNQKHFDEFAEKLLASFKEISPDDEKAVANIVRADLTERKWNLELLKAWFSLPASSNHRDIVLQIAQKRSTAESKAVLAKYILSNPAFSDMKELIQTLAASGDEEAMHALVDHTFRSLDVAQNEDALRLLVQRADSHTSTSITFLLSTEKNKNLKNLPIYFRALDIHNLKERERFLNEQLGPSAIAPSPSSCEGTFSKLLRIFVR